MATELIMLIVVFEMRTVVNCFIAESNVRLSSFSKN